MATEALAGPVGVAVEAGGREASLRARMVALLVLNLLDALFTLAFLQLHLAEEANPLMAAAYAGSPVLFLVLKLALVHSGAVLLWIHRATPAARGALAAGVALYAAIVVYHCSFVARLIVAAASG
ncbi:MAG TPA: DUF5658 family protein [Myxococcaceae bacterium]|nr:DUF5658 family protein [Myxococcaceae bacterium]